MTDFANLVLAVDSTSVPKAVGDLDNLTAAGTRAESSVGSVGLAAKNAGVQATQMAQQAQATAASTMNLATSSKAAAFGMRNLAFQANDVFVGLASGQNPMRVLIQQGPQVAQAFMVGGEAAGQMAYQVGVLIGRFLPLAVVIGTGYAAIKLFQDQLNDQAPADQFVKSLGLTDKEMKKLQDTAITTGDIFTGLWKVIAARTGVDKSISDFRSFMIQAFTDALKGAGAAMAAIYGEVVGTYRAVSRVWDDLPSIFAAAFARAANAAAEKLEAFINRAIGAINSLANQANSLLGTKLFGQIGTVSLGRVEANFSKSFSNIHGIIRGEISSATAEAKGAMQGFIADVAKASIAARDARVRAQAEDIIGDRTNKAAAAHNARAKAAKAEADALKDLGDQLTYLLGKDLPILDKDITNVKPLSKLETPNFKDLLGNTPDMAAQLLNDLKAIADQASVTGQLLSDAFGNAGNVIGGLLSNIAQYGVEQAQLAKQVADGTMSQEAAEKQLAALRVHTTAAALSGLKSLFKEHSAGYKVMSAIEKAYAIFQTVQTVAAIARDVTHTASSVANSATRAAADEAAGASKIFAQLGVWAFPVVAAMVALLATFGLRKGGGGSGSAPTTAENVQAAQGTGTVLGDSTAKSESIAHSLDIMSKNSTKGLDYSGDMVRSLRNIESGIGNLAAAVARSLQLQGGPFDTSGFGLGTQSKGIQGLFGSTTTKSLFDQGFTFNASTVQQIIDQGITGATYNVIEKIKKSSGFLGLGGGTKTSYSTVTGGLPDDVSRQFQLIIGDVYKSVVDAASILGLDVGKALQTFQVEIGKISFKDLKGDEITQALEAVFSKVADQMAGFAVAGLEQFQKAGEGLFETLNRLAKDYLTVDAALKSIGLTFGSVGIASVAAREALIDLMGGLDEFVNQINYYYEHFLTAKEQMNFLQSQVNATFAQLGLSVPKSIDAFKKLVSGADLTTEAGQQLFAALMAIAPAFYELKTAAQQAAEELAKKKTQLQIQLLQAQGKAEEALAMQRKAELDATDNSLKGLQQQIYAAQDLSKAKDNLLTAYKRESGELQQTADKFHKFATDLRSFRDSLFTDGQGGQTYNQALANLIKTGGLASTGDETALGGITGVAKDFLDIAKQNAGSLNDFKRAQALVAGYLDQAITGAEGKATVADQQLAQMKTQVGKLVDIDDHVLTVAEAIQKLNQLLTPASGGGTTPPVRQRPDRHPRQVRDEILQRIHDRLEHIHAATEAVATSTSKTARIFTNADRGGALAMVPDSDI